MTRQKNKRGDSKEESNDSPEIPDREEISDILGLPSGVTETQKKFYDCWQKMKESIKDFSFALNELTERIEWVKPDCLQ